MDLAIEDTRAWAETIFGMVSLGDKRLTRRLIQIGEQLSMKPGSSLATSCDGKEALLEGSYRFLRNKRVNANQIAEGGYLVTSYLCKTIPTVLAIEDTTTLSYSHQLKERLGDLGGPKESSSRGFHVHTTMLMDAEQEKTLGLIAQERWCRDITQRGKKHQRRSRLYTEKESYKWEKNTREIEKRLGSKMSDVISVCDREADVFEYIQYKLERGQRFIVRASHNRQMADTEEHLLERLSSEAALGRYTIEVGQKAGRKKRQVSLELKASTVTLSPPERRHKDSRALKPVTLNVVIAKELEPQDDNALEWVLLTTEDIKTFDCARKITRYYEMRWRIEDFHKAWKTGVGVEEQRMQSVENLEKMIVILSFVAVRLLQLKEYFESSMILEQEGAEVVCDELLTETEWKVLWSSVEKTSLPKELPSATWAYKAIAKLGGWSDSKRTGKAAWSTIWKGWFRLMERLEGHRIASELMKI